MLKASICLSTFNKPELLDNTLHSIYQQKPPFVFETIVVDDGSANDKIKTVCAKFPVRYHRIEREPVFRNPCTARNVAYRMADAEVIIAQSDEILHIKPDTIEKLVSLLAPGTCIIANVFCINNAGAVCGEYTGPGRQKPYFFLGSLYRADLYAVGGNDEEFAICPAYEDDWFGDCLTKGLRLKPVYSEEVVGHHQQHAYCTRPELEGASRDLYHKKVQMASAGLVPWLSAGGPWPLT